MTPHPQAEILRSVADGRRIERLLRDIDNDTLVWIECDLRCMILNEDYKYRIKPETMDINRFEVPMPVCEPLEIGKHYWTPDLSIGVLIAKFAWDGLEFEKLLLERGLVHLTKEAAVAHAEALLSFTRSDK